jgi:hypothetical protein
MVSAHTLVEPWARHDCPNADQGSVLHAPPTRSHLAHTQPPAASTGRSLRGSRLGRASRAMHGAPGRATTGAGVKLCPDLATSHPVLRSVTARRQGIDCDRLDDGCPRRRSPTGSERRGEVAIEPDGDLHVPHKSPLGLPKPAGLDRWSNFRPHSGSFAEAGGRRWCGGHRYSSVGDPPGGGMRRMSAVAVGQATWIGLVPSGPTCLVGGT